MAPPPWLAALVYMSVLSCIHGEMFTALVEMEQALDAEAELARSLDEYIAREEARLAELRALSADMAQHSASGLRDPAHFLGNPINAFLTVKRFTVDWKHQRSELISSDENRDWLLTSVRSQEARFPGDEDLQGAVLALLRLQDTYQLDTARLAQGNIPGVDARIAMSASDCFELGRVAYGEGDQYHTLLWMQEALNTMSPEQRNTREEALALDYLSFATYAQGNLYHARNVTKKWLALEPDHERARSNLQFYEKTIADHEKQKGDIGTVPPDPHTVVNVRKTDEYRSSDEFRQYEALCRDEDVVTNPDAHKLTCQYRFWHPMFYINPLKEETMSFKPWLAVYHDVLTDSEIETVKALATPILGRATVNNPVTGKLEHAKYRISKSSWLKDDMHPVVARVSARCSAITNMTLDTVEELQVVNYGLGGQYEPHYDFARLTDKTKFEESRGNRILTLIFYMSDVEAGGATAFVNAGHKVWPRKGSAAVWYNLLPSGDGDLSTHHAGCPVLSGSKWVANKWFHERGQEFARPCGLTPTSPDVFHN